MAAPKPKTVVFIDYEYLYYSCKNIYHQPPDLVYMLELIKEKANVVDTLIFGSFAINDGEIHQELRRVRTVSNHIIETTNPNENYRKDYTDFIMLDNIYQSYFATQAAGSVHQFILLTGDGHFAAAAAFMRNQGLKIGIIGIPGTISFDLQQIASWVVEYDLLPRIEHMRMQQLVQSVYDIAAKGYRPNFTKTAETMSYKMAIQQSEIERLLRKLFELGVLYSEIEDLGHRQVSVLKIDWAKVQNNKFLIQKNIPQVVEATA